MRNRFFKVAPITIFILAIAVGAKAQMSAMGIPIPTVIVISKPAPGQTYGNQQVITIGVGDKIYKFNLQDAYTNHRKIHWPDIWEQIRIHNPNLQVQGSGDDKFASITPGQTYTVSGFYSPLERTFEVNNFQQGGGAGEKSHY